MAQDSQSSKTSSEGQQGLFRLYVSLHALQQIGKAHVEAWLWPVFFLHCLLHTFAPRHGFHAMAAMAKTMLRAMAGYGGTKHVGCR